MATWKTIEEESGTSRWSAHAHNGYYAGDFSQTGADGSTGRVRGDDRLAMHDLVLVTGERLRLW